MPPLQRMSSRILGFLVATAAFTLLKLAFHGNESLGITSKSENADNYPLLIDREPIHVTIPEHSSSARTISIDTVDGEPTNPSNPEQTIGIQDSAQQMGKSLWIYVEEFSEGMATWRISFAEILMVAKRLNATVVEPCIGGGRLRTCRITKYRLGQVYDLERLRQFHPHIASYAEYQDMLTRETPLIIKMCHQIQGGSPSPLIVCGQNVSNMFQVPSNHLLDQALQQVNATTVIHIMYYRKSGFQNTKVGRNRLVRPRFIESILADYFDIMGHHYETVDNLLRSMGISNNSVLM
ncbi:hypothetical protein MHU86_5015 [Fragilaria crotonensis]|nr:hypothetical protein MHU86_5015 [Fragilaria crotonensis]